MTQLQTILQDLGTAGALAQNYQAGGLALQVKTNFTPAVTVYTEGAAPGAGGAIANWLGLQGGARVVDAAGNVLLQVGAWPATDPMKVALAIGAAGAIGLGLFALLRGRRRR